jgi:hypothetical protein
MRVLVLGSHAKVEAFQAKEREGSHVCRVCIP